MSGDLKCLHCGKEVGESLSQGGLCSECAQLLSTAAAPPAPASGDDPVRPQAGQFAPSDFADRIGPFKILETLGEGGMGMVYLAEQEEPIRRRVALKLIKWGMDTRRVVARFESERQALALMNHPSIARV